MYVVSLSVDVVAMDTSTPLHSLDTPTSVLVKEQRGTLLSAQVEPGLVWILSLHTQGEQGMLVGSLDISGPRSTLYSSVPSICIFTFS